VKTEDWSKEASSLEKVSRAKTGLGVFVAETLLPIGAFSSGEVASAETVRPGKGSGFLSQGDAVGLPSLAAILGKLRCDGGAPFSDGMSLW
jgi:hypothetical protein